MDREIRVGTAGWPLPARFAEHFPGPGPLLRRYGLGLDAVEINTTFYRLHRPETFGTWASLVPPSFKFSVKAPRFATHYHRLGPGADLGPFLEGARRLGGKLGPILVQLPPSLKFETEVTCAFLDRLRRDEPGWVVWEPRHPSWFTDEADRLLRSFQVARVAADPKVVPRAGEPGGWDGLLYLRLHGSPEMYRSTYPQAELERLAGQLTASRVPAWCIFDNDALGEATGNALELQRLLGREPVATPDRGRAAQLPGME